MIAEHHEELASLYVLELLEGAERSEFEAMLAGNPELQSLVRELGAAAAALAHTAPAATPPAALKFRVLASIGDIVTPADNILRPPVSIFTRLTPWSIAACLALLAAWTGQRYFSAVSEVELLRGKQALTDVALQTNRQLVEAERILATRRQQGLDEQFSTASRQLAEARNQLADRDRKIAESERLLVEGRSRLDDRERSIAEVRTQLSDRDRQVASLTQRIDALAGASAEIGRQLGAAKDQVAQLSSELSHQTALADFKITTLASMLKSSPEAQAVAIWDPAKQEGILKVAKLPALLASQDYQLWVVDPQYPNPVDGGVFTVDAQTGEARLMIKAKQPVTAINAFAVTRERKGGVPKAEGPFVLLGK